MNKDDVIILLVEDEPMLQFVFERQVQKLGYKVSDIAGDGLTAVQKVLEQHYHLVFMDVRLPGIDGMTATKRIRETEHEHGKHTNIVGMTAFAERERCLDSGMDDFLQKPVLLEQLEGMLEKWALLDREPSASEPEAFSTIRFQDTAKRLNEIQDRISNLRKRVGLDLSNSSEP